MQRHNALVHPVRNARLGGGGLRALGLGRGDVIAIYMPNVPEAMFAMLAATKIGAIAMPLFSGFGADAMLWGDVTAGLMYGPGYTIMGGTSNVMRNILGERVLGLPKEPGK